MQSRHRFRRTRILVPALLVAGVLLWWWFRPAPDTVAAVDPTPAASPKPGRKQGRVHRWSEPPRAAFNRTTQTLDVPTFAEPPKMPTRPQQVPIPEDQVAFLQVEVVDTSGQTVVGALVDSEDCRFRQRTTQSGARIRVDANEAACTVRARRMDGPLATFSDYQVVDLEAGQTIDVRLTIPKQKTAGMGIQISATEEGMRVGRVVPGSPAAEAGLQTGDVVVSVDGISAAELSVDEFVGLATGSPGSQVKLMVARGGDGNPPEELILVRRLLENRPRPTDN